MANDREIRDLRNIPLMARLPSWQFDAVAEFVEPLRFKKGAKLVERGSDDGFTYFLTAGKLSLESAEHPSMVVEASADRVLEPIANLRPRIVDVTALDRVTAMRVPDLLIDLIQCREHETQTVSTDQAAEAEDKGRGFEVRLPFELYRDLKHGDSTILPSLPDTAVRIQLAIEDDISDADAIARLIVTDPAIVAKLIKTANSALCGGRSPVDTPTAAVVRLGMEVTRQLVLSFALKEVFRTRDKTLRQRMRDLWEHSVLIAATCFVLAREVDGVKPEEALLAGLVHDIGTIAVINYASRDPKVASDPAALEKAISCLRGELGALILRDWKFSPAAVVAARDAECWLREHEGKADVTDLLIVAQVHERLRNQETDGLPKVDRIPAFNKVLGEDASPHKSLVILHQAEVLVEQMRRVLRR